MRLRGWGRDGERFLSSATQSSPVMSGVTSCVFLGDFLTLRPAVVHVWQDSLSIVAGYAARLAGVPSVNLSSRNMAARGSHTARLTWRKLTGNWPLVRMSFS